MSVAGILQWRTGLTLWVLTEIVTSPIARKEKYLHSPGAAIGIDVPSADSVSSPKPVPVAHDRDSQRLTLAPAGYHCAQISGAGVPPVSPLPSVSNWALAVALTWHRRTAPSLTKQVADVAGPVRYGTDNGTPYALEFTAHVTKQSRDPNCKFPGPLPDGTLMSSVRVLTATVS